MSALADQWWIDSTKATEMMVRSAMVPLNDWAGHYQFCQCRNERFRAKWSEPLSPAMEALVQRAIAASSNPA